jgi:protein-S-isoprenylcysteine O-methyltransferase Ste14
MNWKLLLSFVLTIIIPLLYVMNIFLAYFIKNTYVGHAYLILLGILFSFVGLLFWFISFINLRKNFEVLPKRQKPITKGLYRYFKHPMYIGIWLTFLGLSLANQSLPSLLFLFIILTPILIVRARIEEKKLIKQ